MDWILQNWQIIALGFVFVDKVIRWTPFKQDDVIWDMIILPVKEEFVKMFISKKSSNEKKK